MKSSLEQWWRLTINVDGKVVHYPKTANTSSKQNPYVPLGGAGVNDIKPQNALHQNNFKDQVKL